MSATIIVTSDPAVTIQQETPSVTQVLAVTMNPFQHLALGSSAALNVGTAADDVVQLDGSARLPAVDGSQLLNLPYQQLRGFIGGLTVSTAGSSSTFSVAIGGAVDSTQTDFMALLSSMSKTTSAWSAGNGGGALDTGTVTTNTWYHIYLIMRPDTGAVDICASLSPTGPTFGANIPPNFTLYRRIATWPTDAGPHWQPIIQVGDDFLWVTVITVASFIATAGGVNVALAVPPGISVKAKFTAAYVSTSAGSLLYVSSGLAPQNNTSQDSLVVDVGSIGVYGDFDLWTDTAQHIRMYGDGAGTNGAYVYSVGWMDPRGRFS